MKVGNQITGPRQKCPNCTTGYLRLSAQKGKVHFYCRECFSTFEALKENETSTNIMPQQEMSL
jgi:hypothetical protein